MNGYLCILSEKCEFAISWLLLSIGGEIVEVKEVKEDMEVTIHGKITSLPSVTSLLSALKNDFFAFE